jgi:two-component system, NarL family, nitrate/nitrite response regulator NarL
VPVIATSPPPPVSDRAAGAHPRRPAAAAKCGQAHPGGGTPRVIDVAIVTENMIMSDGIGAWLSQLGGLRLAVAAGSVDELVLARDLHPQVVLLDLCRHSGAEPAADVRRLTGRCYRVLALGSRHDLDTATAACEAGARGYVDREQSLTELAVAIRVIASGRFLPRPWAARPGAGVPCPLRPPLSERERAVLTAYVSGMTLEATARQVGVRPETAKTYLRRVKAKYRAAGRPAYTKVELANRVWEERGASARRC